MIDRRTFLSLAPLCAATVAFAPFATADSGSNALAATASATPPMIDGAGGVNLAWFEAEDPLYEKELAFARACGLSAVVLTVAPAGKFWLDDAAVAATRANLAKWRGIIDRHPEVLMRIESASDLERARATKRLGIVFTFQGTEPIGEDLERIPGFRESGVRVIQLTHNRRNLVGDGATEPGNAGISQFGHQLIERLNAERIVVDLAHGSQRTIAEGIAASRAPVLISHTGCRALADLPRNTGDAELRAMAERGGVAGIIFWPYLRTDTQPMAIDVIRHIEHAIKVCGEDHVGIGTDAGIAPVDRSGTYESENREYMRYMKEQGIFAADRPDDLYTFIPDLNRVDRFTELGRLLAERGHSQTRIGKVLGGNFARVMREVWGD